MIIGEPKVEALQAMVQRYRPATKAVSDNAADNLENLKRIWYETNILSLKGTPNEPRVLGESNNLTDHDAVQSRPFLGH